MPDHRILWLRFVQGMFLFKALYWGQRGARDNFAKQITTIVEHGYKSLGEVPVVIGECGVPMDLKYARELNSREHSG